VKTIKLLLAPSKSALDGYISGDKDVLSSFHDHFWVLFPGIFFFREMLYTPVFLGAYLSTVATVNTKLVQVLPSSDKEQI